MAIPFTLDAASHQRGLGGMETGNGTAGYGNEHDGPNGGSFGVHIGQGNFRNGITLHKQHGTNTQSHENQAEAKNRIQLADDFINGKECSTEIIEQ